MVMLGIVGSHLNVSSKSSEIIIPFDASGTQESFGPYLALLAVLFQIVIFSLAITLIFLACFPGFGQTPLWVHLLFGRFISTSECFFCSMILTFGPTLLFSIDLLFKLYLYLAKRQKLQKLLRSCIFKAPKKAYLNLCNMLMEPNINFYNSYVPFSTSGLDILHFTYSDSIFTEDFAVNCSVKSLDGKWEYKKEPISMEILMDNCSVVNDFYLAIVILTQCIGIWILISSLIEIKIGTFCIEEWFVFWWFLVFPVWFLAFLSLGPMRNFFTVSREMVGVIDKFLDDPRVFRC